jgi:hypothetical protein
VHMAVEAWKDKDLSTKAAKSLLSFGIRLDTQERPSETRLAVSPSPADSFSDESY